MESRYIEQSKQDFAQLLLANGSIERSKEIAELDSYEPVFKFREAHDQAEPSAKDLNEMINESYVDINAITIGFREAGKSFHNLMKATDAKLTAVKRQLLIEKEKLEDLNILCNQYTDFNTTINLNDTNLIGNYGYENGILCAPVQSNEAITYAITDIDGNGYEGNDYVYKDNKFLKESIDTSNRRFINDNNNLTVYEYSRITANNSEKEIFQHVNFDSVEAKATLSIASVNPFNQIKIYASSKDTFLSSVAVSTDGISYKNILSAPIEINNESLKYEKVNYIAGSGMLCFPSTKYLKITLQSNGVVDDVIAFEHTVVTNTVNVDSKSRSTFSSNQKTITSYGVESNKDTKIQKEYIPYDQIYVYDRTRQELLLNVLQQKE